MPYRRLPNTDKARLRALSAAHRKGEQTAPPDLAYPFELVNKLSNTLRNFKNVMSLKKESYKARIEANKKFAAQFQHTKLYVSHFIQVLNMSIQRGEHDKSERKYFGIKPTVNKLPEIITTEDLIFWGEAICEGDARRLLEGGNPIYNPRPALIKIELEKFKALLYEKNLRDQSHKQNIEKMKEYRIIADKLIATIWNKVESYFENSNASRYRANCESYGLVYVNRKKENLLKNMF